ncbi:7216_t:CDS:10 [Dentiscutata erythropus]|uniref:7216_t:CDS:1 n=1 Tax=Dentiscutata erythropus TaxID=1348616 RepID=A0A9N9EID1_9GLOM|nr:7216_t:CDS:10 [Dentiscutata erythropus]
MGLSSESHNLLASILKEQKAESIPYQVVNNLNDNKSVDKVVSQFEDILFAESDPEFDQKIEEAALKINDLKEKGEAIDKEIKELKKKYNDSLEKKQTVLETKVNAAVAALKNDLRTVGAGGHRFFEETIKSNKIVSEEKYKSDTSAIPGETYGSVIKTNVNASSNGKSYTNAVYLSMDFQGLKLKLFGFGDKSTMTGVSNEGYVKENMETHRYMSDIFYVMHALFPKDSEDASIIGKNYVTSPGGSVSIMRAPFPCEVKKLTWANVLSSDAVNDEVIRDEISVYENKIRLKYSLLANSSILVDKYEKYVENLLKGLTEAGTTTPIFQKGELESLQAKNLKYEDIKDKISVFPSYTIKLIEAYPGNKVVDKFDDDVTNENSAKWSELAEVNAEKDKINTEKEAIEDRKNKAKKESLKTDATFDPAAELAKLDVAETNNQVVKNYLQSIKDSLESVGRGLDPVEQNELDQLTHYIENGEVPSPERRILPMELKAALGANEIKELADRVNGAKSKINKAELIKYCKEVLAKKPELIDDTYDLPNDQAKDNLKKQILKKMEDYKEDQKGLVRLDLSVYGDGKEFSEDGIIKYYTEKLGGQDHAKKHYKKSFEDNKQENF